MQVARVDQHCSCTWYAAEPALLAKADPRACPAALPKLGKNIAEIY